MMNRQRPYPTLKHWRQTHRLNQRAAARELGITQASYSRMETGLQYPRRHLAKTISERTGVPLETILGLV